MSGAVELEAELRAEIERYIARCREMSEGGKYSWWTRLAEILATLRADNERLGRERDADIDALHGTFSKPIAVLQERVADLIRQVHENPSFFDEVDDEEYDTECGLHCATDEAA